MDTTTKCRLYPKNKKLNTMQIFANIKKDGDLTNSV